MARRLFDGGDELGLADRVKFKGFVPQEELKTYYRECSVVALSSVWPEPIATIGLAFLSPWLVDFAVRFGPEDYFALMCVAFITVSATFGDSPIRGLTSWVDGGKLVCPYHGWAFDGGGACTKIPSLAEGRPLPQSAKVPAFAVCEQDGYVWICPGDAPADTRSDRSARSRCSADRPAIAPRQGQRERCAHGGR